MIKLTVKNIFIIFAAFLMVVACQHVDPTPTPLGYISMVATEAGQTRALLDENTFMKSGNELQIYDIYTPKGSETPQEVPYISDQVMCAGSDNPIWPFVGNSYSWTDGGKHKFFGWLCKDVNMPQNQQTADSFFGKQLQLDQEYKLSLPKKTIDQSTAQFDFMYSNIYERDLNDETPDYVNPVELEFSHLFTAFSVAVKNESENIKYRLRSLTIEGLVTTCSAVIDFSGGKSASVSYNTPGNANGNTADYSYTFDKNNRLILSKELKYISTGSVVSESPIYNITWPMTAQQAGQVKITVVYDTGSDTGSDTGNGTSTELTLSEKEWAAGKKNNISIVFIDKEVQLICTVKDWTYEEEEMQFTDVVTVHETGKIRWEENSIEAIDKQSGEVLVKNSRELPAVATFHIETPIGAIWHASLIATAGGQVGAFEFVGPNTGVIGEEPATIMIIPRNITDPAPTQKAILRIIVTTGDGRTVVVNELVPDDAGYTEYTIVQNMI